MKPDSQQTRRDLARTLVREAEVSNSVPGPKRLYITQDDGIGGNQWFFSSISGGTSPFTCVANADGTGDDVEVNWDVMFNGVFFTGQVVFCERLLSPVGTERKLSVAQDGVSAWYGVEADGDIIAGDGNVLLAYRRFCPGGVGSVDFCRVPVVAGDATFNVASGGLCDVAFNQQTGEFHVTRAYCPGA